MILALLATLALHGGTPPDIVLVVMDDVGYADLVAVRDAGFAPNMAAMATTGFVFTNATSAPICSPSRRMMYFGEFYSRQSGPATCSAADGTEPPIGMASIAQVLTGVGYSTALLGKWHLGSNPFGPWQCAPQVRGFSDWQAGVYVGVAGCGGASYSFWTEALTCASSSSVAYQPTVMRQRFEALWASLPQPRFVVFAAQLAHAPYHRPPPGLLPEGYPTTPSDRTKYEAMIAALDTQVGQLRAVATDAVFIVVGDNGTPEAVSSNPSHAKTTTFQGGVHVPLFMNGPGIEAGSSQALVSVADLYATLAELGGACQPATDSASLLPLVYGTATKVHDYIAFGIQGDAPQFVEDVGVRSLQYKYRRWRVDAAQPWTEELYDLLADPSEMVNVASLYPQKLAQHRAVADAEVP